MSYQYTENDFIKLSWEEVQSYNDKMLDDIKGYISHNNLTIKYIIPVHRGGGHSGLYMAYKLGISKVLPVQLRHDNDAAKIVVEIDLDNYRTQSLKDDECILLVEGKHSTGTTANIAKNMVLSKFGKNTKIIYAALSKDYSYKDSVDRTIFSTHGFYINEEKKLSQYECKKLGIEFEKVYMFPWEDIRQELENFNCSKIFTL